MRTTFRPSAVPAIAALVLFMAEAPVAGQASASSVPRSADGKPDFSGIWQTMNSAAWNVEDHAASFGVPAGQGVVDGGTIPYLPAAVAKRNENFTNRAAADPENKCYLLGVPRITYAGFPFQIIQMPAAGAVDCAVRVGARDARHLHERHSASARSYRLVDG